MLMRLKGIFFSRFGSLQKSGFDLMSCFFFLTLQLSEFVWLVVKEISWGRIGQINILRSLFMS